MRWPFGPPHLTLKPSKNKNKTETKQKQNKKTNQNKQKMKKKLRRSEIPKHDLSVISQNLQFFGGGGPKSPGLTTWPKKRAPKKHYKNRGYSKPIFEKQIAVTKQPFLE